MIVYTARMTTHHFTFEATGISAGGAKKTLLAGWRRHLRECIDRYVKEGGCAKDSEMADSLKMSLTALNDYYGITVTKCEPGVCLRDGSRIWKAGKDDHG